jgi:hypothetical protein
METLGAHIFPIETHLPFGGLDKPFGAQMCSKGKNKVPEGKRKGKNKSVHTRCPALVFYTWLFIFGVQLILSSVIGDLKKGTSLPPNVKNFLLG